MLLGTDPITEEIAESVLYLRYIYIYIYIYIYVCTWPKIPLNNYIPGIAKLRERERKKKEEKYLRSPSRDVIPLLNNLLFSLNNISCSKYI